MTVSNRKCATLVALVVVAIAGAFWTGSRYPALDEKALMAGAVDYQPLGYDEVLVIESDDSFARQVFATTVNWLDTNKKGMTFGVVFAAAILTLLSLVTVGGLRGGASNSLFGLVLGAPLGVCVNCAAPIAQGLHRGGLREETTLAALVSSPTLNVVVLTMLLSLFPPYVAVLKIGATVLFVLVAIPLLVRILGGAGVAGPAGPDASTFGGALPAVGLGANAGLVESWSEALRWTARALGANLWYIVRMTVPLMFLAGLLGGVLITLVPWQTLTALPGILGMGFGRPGAIVVAAVIGILLPVPITFDVAIVAALMAAGLSVGMATALLFTLGIFSVYAFFIVGQTMSWRLSAAVMVALAGLGAMTGAGAHIFGDWWLVEKANKVYDEVLAQEPRALRVKPDHAATSGADILDRIADNVVAFTPVEIRHSGDGETMEPAAVEVERAPFRSTLASRQGLAFERRLGQDFGLDFSYPSSLPPMVWPYGQRGITAGDVHGDGWPDLAVTDEGSVRLFANTGGRFDPQHVAQDSLAEHHVVAAALVDLDGDGWLDLFASTYGGGNWLLVNDGGRFDHGEWHRLPNRPDAMLTFAPGFGDLDQDGDLDILLGNWTVGFAGAASLPSSKDAWLRSTPSGYELEPLDGPGGETLSTLITDLDGDARPDLFIGNDFVAPDLVYVGEGRGRFRRVLARDSLVLESALTTMSLSSGDVDNDLTPEIYVAQVTGVRSGARMEESEVACSELPSSYRTRCSEYRETKQRIVAAALDGAPAQCLGLADDVERQECVVKARLFHIRWRSDSKSCGYLGADWRPFDRMCRDAVTARSTEPADSAVEIPSQSRRQLLLTKSNGRYVDRAREMGVPWNGWAWNAKFFDADNDGWQDLYVVTGFPPGRRSGLPDNYFYHNNGGSGFSDKTVETGLGSFRETTGFVALDVDRDGDLDIVATPVVGPLWVYENVGAVGNVVAFELRDSTPNRFGIGARIVIRDTSGSVQMRDVLASGGFLSFDAPVATFGTGSEGILAVEIKWPDGHETTLDGPFEAGFTYRISRRPGAPRRSSDMW